MKLEVGMYCFNKTNRKMGIGKIISFQSNNNVNVKYKNDIELVSIGNITASFDIIDLIEVRDYVNGLKVIDIVENNIYISDYYAESYIGIVKVKDIKSIVTKELFENMEYRIGDNK